MERGSATEADQHFHPCYVMNNVSKTLSRTSSSICVSLYVFLGSLSVITLCGNVLVIIAIVYFKQLHTPSNYLIVSLAVTDLFVGSLVFPLSTSFPLSSCLFHRDSFCKVRDSFDVILSSSSIFNLCCISVDRYYAVCHPLTYRSMITGTVVIIMIVFSWGVSVLVAVGFIVTELFSATCEHNCLANVVLEKVLAPVFSFYLPVSIMLYIYLRIYLVAKKQACSIQIVEKSKRSVTRMERKATKTLAIVMGVFLLCWLPFFLCFSLQLLGSVSVSVYESLNWLALSNSMLNPFIYAFFYSWFRSAIRWIILGKVFQRDFSNTKLF